MQYNWIFEEGSFKCVKSLDGLSNVVEAINWQYEVTDGDISASTRGTTELPVEGIENFIPFEELTRQTVIEWLESLNDVDLLKALADYELGKEVVNRNKVSLNPPF